MSRLVLYPFRFRDPLTGRWIRARHKAQVPELQRCYAEWEITGAPEVRQVSAAGAKAYDPFRSPVAVCIAPALPAPRPEP